jgi:hypothetical protein
MFVSLNWVCVDKKINGVYALVGKRELFCIVDGFFDGNNGLLIQSKNREREKETWGMFICLNWVLC